MAASRSCIVALLGLLAACCLFATASAGRVAPVESLVTVNLEVILKGCPSTDHLVVTVVNAEGKPIVFELVGGVETKLKKIVHLAVGDGKGILELHIVGGKINKVLKSQLVDLNSVFGLLEDITGTVDAVLQLVNKGKGGLELQNLLGEILGTCSL
jgi:hypothetical protein